MLRTYLSCRYDLATYGTHPWVFRDMASNQLMAVQFQTSRMTSFEAYRFVSEKQQLGLLNREQVLQVMSGRCVLSVGIVAPFYSLDTLRQRSLDTIATLVRSGIHDGGHGHSAEDHLDRLGMPAMLQQKLLEMLGGDGDTVGISQ